MIIKNKDKGIISIAMVFGVGFFALSLALTMAVKNLAETAKNSDSKRGSEAFYLSESAMREGYYQYKKDPSYSGDNSISLNKNFLTRTVISNDEWPYKKLLGIADGKNTHRETVYKIEFPESIPFDCAIYSNNNLRINGGNGLNVTNGGKIFVRNNFINKGNINVEVVNSSPFDIPNPEIDIEEYLTKAENDGLLVSFAKAEDAIDHLGENNNEVLYIEESNPKKDPKLNTNFTGSLVTESNLEINGGTYNAINNYATFIVNGDLKFSGDSTINGIVFVKGETNFTGGNTTINGSLISLGEIGLLTLGGSVTINYNSSDWKNLAGLQYLVASSSPKIIQWLEQLNIL